MSDPRSGSDSPRPIHPTPAESELTELKDFFYTLVRRWWLIVLSVLLSVGVASYAMARQRPSYVAEVLLRQALSGSPVSLDPTAGQGSDFGSQLEVIRSRAVLEPVVTDLQLRFDYREVALFGDGILDSVRVTPRAEPGVYVLAFRHGVPVLLGPEGESVLDRAGMDRVLRGDGFTLHLGARVDRLVEPTWFRIQAAEEAIDHLRGRVRVEPGKGAEMVRVSYADRDPVRAADVVNAVARSYIEYGARSARDAAARRKEFLAEQLGQLADSLQRTEGQFLRYQEQHGLLDPQDEGGNLAAALMEAENAYRSYGHQESLLDGLEASLQSEGSATAAGQRMIALGKDLVPGGQELSVRLADLEMERNRLTASRFGHTDRSPQVEVIDSLMASNKELMRTQVAESKQLLEARRREAGERAARLRSAVGAVPERSAEFARLQQRVQAVQRVFDMLVSQYYEAQIAEAVEAGDVELVDPAPVPRHSRPVNQRLNLAIALCLGLMLSVGGIGAARYLDNTVQRRRDVLQAVNLPVLGLIPYMEGKPEERTPGKLAGVEAFRTLAAALWFGRPPDHCVIAITSAAPKEGKSTISANLAVALAQMGARVLLIDGDIRRPVVDRTFELRMEPGFTDVVTGEVALEDAIQVSERSSAHILTRGCPSLNPAALVVSAEFSNLMERLRSMYDMVIIDSSPVLAVAEVGVVSAQADQVILTAWAGRTDRGALRQAADRLRSIHAPLAGVVITSVPTGGARGRSAYGYYQYSSYHGPVDGAREDGISRRLRLVGGRKSRT